VYAERKKWKALVAKQLLFLTPESPFKTAKLTLIRHSSSEPDFDGLVSSFKSSIDSLVECGVIENDKPSNIGQQTYLWRKAPPKKGFIEIIVDPIP
jgi:hypothetical protein